jgi:hypothetical protein
MSYSGLWNNEYGEDHALLTNRTGNQRTRAARVFANKQGAQAAEAEIVRTLNGAATGSTALQTEKRIANQSNADSLDNNNGGVRQIDTITNVNRVTTSADQNTIDDYLSLDSKPTYVADAAGNGGGGKLGY